MSAQAGLDRFLADLRKVFARTPDKHAAHRAAAPVLQAMAASPGVLTSALERHVSVPGALNAKHYPVVSLELASNAHFGLVANCWIPLASGDTNMSTKAIHHHGEMLLTTVTSYGPGYEHWMFTTPAAVEPGSDLFTMTLIERAPHPLGHAAFVDANIGHVPFFPPSLTITLALWSSRRRTSWLDAVKRVPSLHKHSVTLRKMAAAAGLTRMLDLKLTNYFDFFPSPEGFKGMKEREEFPRGPNEDYLYSLFHVLQRTGNAGTGAAVRAMLQKGGVENSALVERLLADLDRDRPIEGRLSAGHYGVPFANFPAQDIEQALAVCATRGGTARA
jgi:hypothetical protein